MEILTGIIIIFLSGLLFWEKYENRKLQSKLINSVMSKNAVELRDLEVAEKTNIKLETKPPEFVPEDNLTDEQFQKIIEGK